MDVGNLAQWAGAAATTAAVLVALFKHEFLRRWRRPLLGVSCRAEPPYCAKTQLGYRAGNELLLADAYYCRLWIENEGLSRAESVQVYLSRVSRRGADGAFRTAASFLPMNLRWSHGPPPPAGPEIFTPGISPKMGKHCDLGHITDPRHRRNIGEELPGIDPTRTLLALDLEVTPNSRTHLLIPGTYRLELRLAAANCPPTTKTIEFTITGDWYDDETQMLRDGCGISLVD